LIAALLMSGGPALAQAPQPGTVSTQATARTQLANTVADVVLRVEARGTNLAEVQQALSTGSASLVAYLKTTAAQQTRTEGVRVDPQLEQNSNRGQPVRIVGYAGQVSVAFQIEAGALGSVLGEALGHGANAVSQTSLHPRQAEIEAARQALAIQATTQALGDAKAVAEAAGRHLGAVRSILVGSAVPGPVRYAMAAAPAPSMFASTAAPIATEAGESEVSATVNVVISLIEP
jgi:uncharacterized protein YggE